MGRHWLWLGGALLAALVLAIVATTPPHESATPGDDPTEVSASRAFAQVQALAQEPHPTGSEANARVRSYLVGELEKLGFTVETTTGKLDERAQAKLDHWDGEKSSEPAEFVNIIGILPGQDRALPAVALMAHYDSVWGSPGAADDAAGVASILETVRTLHASGPLPRDVVVILTDAEELGLNGARDFFAKNPLAGRIGAVINLEARGGGGIASMFQTSPGNAEVAKLYARVVDHPSTSSLSAFIYSVLPNDTDLSATLDRGGDAAYNIAFIGRSGLYHSPLATPENLDRGSLNQMLGQTHALAKALVNSPEFPRETTDAVFFDLFGQFVVVFPPWLGWVMLALGLGGYAAAWRKDGNRTGSIATGAGRMTALVVGGGILLWVLNWLSGNGVGAGYYDRLAAIPKLMWMAGLGLLAVFFALWGRVEAGLATRVGAAVPVALLAIVAQALAPTAAYFLVIPMMLAGIVEAVRSYGGITPGKAAAALVAAVVTGYMLSLGYQMMQGVGPSMPWVTAIPMAVAVLGWLALQQPFPRSRTIAAVMLLAAVAVSLWVRLDPVPASVAVYSPLKPG